MVARRSPALDRVDIAILSALQRNGRSTVQSLADRVGLSPRACLERIRRLETAKIITGYQAIIDIAALSRPINVFAEIILERQARQVGFERRLARIDNVVECWEVGGTVDYIARFVCPDLALYEELTKELIEDDALGVARIVSHVALRPIRRFTGYPDSLLTRQGDS
jgi:DNA-binding Lrp family transcriptional regulator